MELEVEILEVREFEENFAVKLKETPFYPDGKGGQLGDRGTIGDATVMRVFEKSGDVWHVVDKPLHMGKVIARIDTKRRKDIAQQHTAQHILSAAFIETSGIETVGFHMGEEYSTVDLDVPLLTEEALCSSLRLANEIVQSCLTVEILKVQPENVGRYRLRKPVHSKVIESGESVRLVKIGEFDISACSGFHVENTGMVGMIAIFKAEKIKTSQTRVYFLAGRRLERYIYKVTEILGKVTSNLTCSTNELATRVDNLLKEMKNVKNFNKRLSERLAREIALRGNFEQLGNVNLVLWEDEAEVATFLPKYLENYLLVAKTKNGFLLASDIMDCSKVVEKLRDTGVVKGGGAGRSRGQIISDLELREFKKLVKRVITDADTSAQY